MPTGQSEIENETLDSKRRRTKEQRKSKTFSHYLALSMLKLTGRLIGESRNVAAKQRERREKGGGGAASGEREREPRRENAQSALDVDLW